MVDGRLYTRVRAATVPHATTPPPQIKKNLPSRGRKSSSKVPWWGIWGYVSSQGGKHTHTHKTYATSHPETGCCLAITSGTDALLPKQSKQSNDWTNSCSKGHNRWVAMYHANDTNKNMGKTCEEKNTRSSDPGSFTLRNQRMYSLRWREYKQHGRSIS